MKEKIPAQITFENTGDLPDMFYDWPSIIADCREAILEGKKYVVAPIPEPVGTKKNKSRVDKEDKQSPLGLIKKEIDHYYPFAAARFDAEEMVQWAVRRFVELPEEEQELFVAGMEPEES